MDAQTCILTRRSVRQFTDQPVPHELLEDVVALAAYAPSWKNTQISRYLAIEDPAVRETIASEYCLAGANNPARVPPGARGSGAHGTHRRGLSRPGWRSSQAQGCRRTSVLEIKEQRRHCRRCFFIAP